MIEVTGQLTLVSDPKRPDVAVPDIVPEWEPEASLLYRKLLDLLGKDVYVLVLPKAEMLVMCQCNHTYADHLEFTNWHVDRFSHAYEPSLDETHSHLSYAGADVRDNVYCKCRTFRKSAA